MLSEEEQFYCMNCKHIFDHMRSIPYYTMNNFIDNQIGILFDDMGEKHYIRRHKIIMPKQLVNCPKCKSRKTINIPDVTNGKLTVYSRRIMIDDNAKCLRALGKQMKQRGEINGYEVRNLKHGHALYETMRLDKKFKERFESPKNKLLNTTNDNIRVEDRK